MSTYSLQHLTDHALLHDLKTLVAQDRITTAALLAHLAEVDARKLYLPAAYESMYEYCLSELGFSEDVACKRIRAARAAREFPALLAAIADGRLHLSAVLLIAPHLAPENADELIAAAAHKSKPEVAQLLAQRFPRPDIPARLAPVSPPAEVQPCLAVVGLSAPGRMNEAPDPGPGGSVPAKVTPLSPQRFALQITIGQKAHDDLRYAQALLGHQAPSGNVARVAEEKRARAALNEKSEEVIPYLRALGIRAGEARQAAAICETIPDAPLEERVKHALKTWFAPRSARLRSRFGDS